MTNITSNKNSESLFRWLIRRSDPLESICFFYISVSNANNARYAPLFEHTKNIRIVYFKGLSLKYSDRILLVFFRKIPVMFRKKIERYESLHIFSLLNWPITKTQILHVDDPLYSVDERKAIARWERNLIANFAIPILICTNQYTYNWYKTYLSRTKVMIIEQGFSKIKVEEPKKRSHAFTCVFSSPYIHYFGDKHGSHSTWGAKVLIDEVIPKLYDLDPSIRVELIGELGEKAREALDNYSNWISFGRVDPIQNQVLISHCDLGLYPRMFDHKRSILKIMSYLGAGVPIVTFDLIDTKIVKDYDLGPVVSNINDFVLSIIKLKNHPDLLNYYKKNVMKINTFYTWENLSEKMEKEISLL